MNYDRFNSNEDFEFSRIEYNEGMSARRHGRKILHNPYKAGTTDFKAWAAGWADADMKILNKDMLYDR